MVLVFRTFGLDNLQAHEILYLLLAGLSVSVTPFLLKIRESKTSAKAKSIREFLPKKSRAVLVRYSVTAVLIAIGAGLFVPLMSTWFGDAFGVPDTVSGPIIGTSGFLIAVFALGAPNLAQRFGLVKSIVLTQGLSMIFMVAVPLSPTFAIAGTVYIVRTFIMNVAGPLGTSLIMGLVVEEERGAASGISAAIWKLPNSISTGIGGIMIQEGYLALPFYVASLLYAASIGLFWAFFRNARAPEEIEEIR